MTVNRLDSPGVAYSFLINPDMNILIEKSIVTINPSSPPMSSREPALKSKIKYWYIILFSKLIECFPANLLISLNGLNELISPS